MRLCYVRVYTYGMCLPPVNKKPLVSGACVVTGEKWVETSFLFIYLLNNSNDIKHAQIFIM
jgi:hypothetical protein